MIVESEEESDQVIIVTHDDGRLYTVISIGNFDTIKDMLHTQGLAASNIPFSDSSFSIGYARYEGLDADTIVVIEKFSTSLQHRIPQDSSLDYGTMTFGGVPLTRSVGSARPWIVYEYTSAQVNGYSSTSTSPWSDVFRLEQPPFVSAVNSSQINDMSVILPTKVPNRIMNIVPGQVVIADHDLEIVFEREILKNTVVSIGNRISQSYYHFELLKSTKSFQIPFEYLRLIKGESGEIVCELAMNEQLLIGSMTSENILSHQVYRVPIFEFTINSILIKLTD